MIAYPIRGSNQRIILQPSALEHLKRHRQTRWWHREAGGQLFARFAMPDIFIEEVTGPRRSDWRTRFSYCPDRRAEQHEIATRHKVGLHFVGDWHTHPEAVPTPSFDDSESMQDLVARSQHALNGFLLIIVGKAEFPKGLSVCIYNKSNAVRLAACPLIRL
jgi:integrative and conjugative element protein (TIGR02256 family)